MLGKKCSDLDSNYLSIINFRKNILYVGIASIDCAVNFYFSKCTILVFLTTTIQIPFSFVVIKI